MTGPSSHFRDQANEARLTRMWSTLDGRLDQAERRRRWRSGGLALAACCVAVALFMLGAHFAPRAQPTASPSMATHVIELADHSRIEHAAQDHVELESVSSDRVVVRVHSGRARFDITPNPGREFLTHARGYTVRVLGTEYVVDLKREALRVEVTRGLVEVRHDRSSASWRIGAGQHWSSEDEPSEPQRASEPLSLPADAAADAADAAAPAAPRARRSPSKPVAPEIDAATLFQQAQDERIAGRPERAAAVLTELLQRFPRDSRAGVSAFELARLRLDLGDARGALEALDRASRAGYALVEQVEMRRVQALEEAGELQACRSARVAFLTRFPASSFSSMVRRRCP